jgi:hypothetical protein
LVSGISVIATKRAYQQAVPDPARKMCRPIFSVRSDVKPPRRAIGAMNRRGIRFWNNTTTPVDVY